jgi:hypothetical protein
MPNTRSVQQDYLRPWKAGRGANIWRYYSEVLLLARQFAASSGQLVNISRCRWEILVRQHHVATGNIYHCSVSSPSIMVSHDRSLTIGDRHSTSLYSESAKGNHQLVESLIPVLPSHAPPWRLKGAPQQPAHFWFQRFFSISLFHATVQQWTFRPCLILAATRRANGRCCFGPV